MLFAFVVFVYPSKRRGTRSSGTGFLSALQPLPLRPVSLGMKGMERRACTRLAQGPGCAGQRQPQASPARAGHRDSPLAPAPGAIPVSLNEQV